MWLSLKSFFFSLFLLSVSHLIGLSKEVFLIKKTETLDVSSKYKFLFNTSHLAKVCRQEGENVAQIV
jgi:hypothetical protein